MELLNPHFKFVHEYSLLTTPMVATGIFSRPTLVEWGRFLFDCEYLAMSKTLAKKIQSTQGVLSGKAARFYAFAAFLIIVFATGGASRDDVQSLVFLRPLAALFGAYALTCSTWECWKGRLFPVWIACALAGLMLLQLIPLPPQFWTTLPGRQIFADIADLAGIEQPWRPLSLSPSRTLNSFFSLMIPISAMMLYLNLDKGNRKKAVAVLIVLAGISALWAIFQITGSSRGPLYLYRITNIDAAVGLFANRNHQAVLLAATIVMLGWYGASHAIAEKLAALKLYGSIAAIFVLVPLIFITGSRAGLILMVPALLAAMSFIYFGRYTVESQSAGGKSRARKKRFASRQFILAGSIILVAGMATLTVYFSRSLAFDRLIGGNDVEELRTQLLPILVRMAGGYFPWGSGFGSFEYVYRIYEPQELLNPSYLNQAHNDWLQFIIEGGLPGIIIAFACVIWICLQLFAIVRNKAGSRYAKHGAIMAGVVMLLLLAGSIGDYPLRVPSLITVFAIMACVFRDHILIVQRNVMKTKT